MLIEIALSAAATRQRVLMHAHKGGYDACYYWSTPT